MSSEREQVAVVLARAGFECSAVGSPELEYFRQSARERCRYLFDYEFAHSLALQGGSARDQADARKGPAAESGYNGRQFHVAARLANQRLGAVCRDRYLFLCQTAQDHLCRWKGRARN